MKRCVILQFVMQLISINSLSFHNVNVTVIMRLNQAAAPLRLLVSSRFHTDFT